MLYGVASLTLLVNLVWKTRAISPLMSILPVTPEAAVVNAWVNVGILCVALIFYLAPLLKPRRGWLDHEGTLRTLSGVWEASLLGAALLILLATLGVMLWRGRTVGAQIAHLQPALRLSLESSLNQVDTLERVVVVNWPRAISADSSVNLGGIIPVTPPSLFLPAPEQVNRSATWVQYQPWQPTPGLDIEYHGAYVTQAELATLVHSARRVVTFNPHMRQMYILAERQPAIAPPACLASFDDRVCLTAARAVSRESMLGVDLTWQAIGGWEAGSLSADVTVFVHVADSSGNLMAQADGDPAGSLVPLASLNADTAALYETRLLAVPPGDYLVRVGLYDRASGGRLTAQCASPTVCVDDAVEVDSDNP